MRTRRTVLLLTATALSTVGAGALPASSDATTAAPVFGHDESEPAPAA